MNKLITKKLLLLATLFCFSTIIFAKQYSISESGKQFIKDNEDCKLEAYWDSNGYSIGYGHHNKSVYKGMVISKSKAEKFFKEDVKLVENAANKLINELPYKCNFSQGFFDGLCDFIYNCGIGSVIHSSFYDKLSKCRVRNGIMNKKDYEYTVAQIKTCCIKFHRNKERRHETHKMML